MVETPQRFSFVDLWREATRELNVRRHVFDKMVKRGEMNIADANSKIALMAGIAEHFRPLAEAEENIAAAEREKNQPRLF